jgi:hypothetical protein
MASSLPQMSEDVLRLNPGLALAGALVSATPSKYGNAKAEAHGMTFASGHEAAVISGLILMEQQHKIFGLRLQVRFPLQGGVVYVCDACYLDEHLVGHVIDAKGFRTREYRNKAKQFKAQYGRTIEEL